MMFFRRLSTNLLYFVSFILTGLLLLAIFVWILTVNNRVQQKNLEIESNYRFFQDLNSMESLISESEEGLKNYLLTGKISHTKPLGNAPTIIDTTINHLLNLNILDKLNTLKITQLRGVFLKKIETINEIIKLKDLQGDNLAMKSYNSAYYKELGRKISNSLTELILLQKKHVDELKNEVRLDNIKLKALIYSAVIILIILVTLAYFFWKRKTTENKEIIKSFADNLENYLVRHSESETQAGNQIIDTMVSDLKTASDVIHRIGEGDYDFLLNGSKKISIDKNKGTLFGNLINTREKLKKLDEESKNNAIEEEQRDWTNKGIAAINETLRRNANSIENLSDEVIRTLIKYLQANQAGLFVLNDDTAVSQRFLELKAAYAMNRKKYLTKKVTLGEGLIGACAVEKETVHLTEIPEGYIKITSGLGAAEPKSLLIVPLKMEENILGVLEIASFNAFNDFEIAFVEKVAESIASSISITKINSKTAKLLAESRQKSEALASQEEEMRQNMEELQSTQEAALKKEMEMSGIISAIDHSLIMSETAPDGTVLTINEEYQKIMGFGKEQLVGKNIKNYIPESELKDFTNIWEEACKGTPYRGTIKRKNKNGDDVWLLMSYTPVEDENGNIVKILYLANDITEIKAQQGKGKEQEDADLSALETQFINLKKAKKELTQEQQKITNYHKIIETGFLKLESTIDGQITYINQNFASLLGYVVNDLLSLKIEAFIPSSRKDEFRKTWHGVCEGNSHQGFFELKNKSGKATFLQLSLSRFEIDQQKGVSIFGIDITEHYSTKEENKAQIEKLQKIENDLKTKISSLESEKILLSQSQEQLTKESKATDQKIENEKAELIKTWQSKLDAIENELKASREKEKGLSEKNQQLEITNKELLIKTKYKAKKLTGDAKDEIENLYKDWLNSLNAKK